MIDRLRQVLEADSRISYALLFGSAARGTAHVHSDVDVAIGLAHDQPFSVRDLGSLMADLEAAAARVVQVVLLDEAPPGLAYRVFRDGVRLMVRDEQALKTRLARAILEYLDFKPIEEMLTQGVLRARHGR